MENTELYLLSGDGKTMPRNRNQNLARSPKKKTIHIACEGGATGTEGSYIKELCIKYNCLLLPNTIYKGSADPLTLAESALDFSKRNPIRIGEKIEIWVVFDNDEPEKVKQAFSKIAAHNRFITHNYMPIHIALNIPCVEIWGLLCCRLRQFPQTAKRIQEELKKLMPTYDHNINPKFDMVIMEQGCDSALHQASAWETSLNGEPEYVAGYFAGIYKIVKSIKE